MNGNSQDPPRVLALDGIDGAGKTLVCTLVAERSGGRAAIFEKRKVTSADPVRNARIAALRGLVWDGVDDTPDDPAADGFSRFLVIAAFYTLIAEELKHLLSRDDRIWIVDGWWPRHLSKTALRTGRAPASLIPMLGTVPQMFPVHHVLLDVPPEQSFARGEFSNHECGFWDGFEHLRRRDGYIAYQSKVRDLLRSLPLDWTVIRPTAGQAPDEIAEALERHIGLAHIRWQGN